MLTSSQELTCGCTQSKGAVERIQGLLDQPEPKLIRVGVRNKGCAGMSYHLEYVDKPEKFDEVVEQDGVRVVIDSKALFSIIGSEMDWQEDALQARFVFNSESTCISCSSRHNTHHGGGCLVLQTRISRTRAVAESASSSLQPVAFCAASPLTNPMVACRSFIV